MEQETRLILHEHDDDDDTFCHRQRHEESLSRTIRVHSTAGPLARTQHIKSLLKKASHVKNRKEGKTGEKKNRMAQDVTTSSLLTFKNRASYI
jgi:hypothetical protein